MMAAAPNPDTFNRLIRVWKVGLVLSLIASIVVLVWRTFAGQKMWWTFHGRNQDRRDDLQALAAKLGFDGYEPERDEGFVMGWGFLSRLSRGDDRYAFNVLRGKYHEQQLFVFDYHYRVGSGDDKQDCYGTMLMLVTRESFPQVTISPEKLRDKFAVAFGVGDEIQFESVEFSRNFSVRSKDKKFAYDVCTPQMMEYLLAQRDLNLEIQGPVISLAFEPQLRADQIEFNLQRLAQIRSLLPEYLFTNA